MKITKALAAHAAEQLGLDAELVKDLTGNQKAIADCVMAALAGGKLSAKKLAELQEAEDQPDPSEKAKQLVGSAVSDAVAPMAKGLSDLTDVLTKRFAEQAASAGDGKGAKIYGSAGGGEGGDVRVKCISERFDRSTKQLFHPSTEKALVIRGDDHGVPSRDVMVPSQFDKAIAGAYLKFMVSRSDKANGKQVPAWAKMSEQDHKLVEYAMKEMDFIGPVGAATEEQDGGADWIKGGRLTEMQQKALLDDDTSGGLEAVPIVFDTIAVLTPLLEGQLFPYVDVRTTTRRRVEGFAMANPTVAKVAEGTAAAEFDTADFITAFDTNVHPVMGWMEVGLDFESDSPVAIADLLIDRYGLVMRNHLDQLIATGSGSGEALGIFNTPGITVLETANDSTGPWTMGDIERLMFGVDAAFRVEAARAGRFAFVGNDTVHQRLRSIAVGTSDQRRVLGNGYLNASQEPMIGEIPYRIATSVGNRKLAAVCLNRYTMYRRAGFSVTRGTEDADLMKRNKSLYVFRMRIGGQLNHSDAAVVYEDGQT